VESSHAAGSHDSHTASGWSDVDRTANASTYVKYLDAAMSWARDYKRRTYELLALQPGHRVLDVGCGTGDDVRAIAALVRPGGCATGIDGSAAMIAEAQLRSTASDLPVEFRVGDAHHLEFADQTFDGARADRTLQHLAAPAQALAEVARVLKHGGRCVVVEPDWDSLVIDASDRTLTRTILAFRCDSYRQGWIGRQLARLLTRTGFVDVQVNGICFTLSDYATADGIFGLEKAVMNAAAAAVISQTAAEGWLNDLRTASAAGVFFCAVAAFVGVARKP
jgi:ubiquinone/menaquinone biosynthesis C-methylase UbiE